MPLCWCHSGVLIELCTEHDFLMYFCTQHLPQTQYPFQIIIIMMQIYFCSWLIGFLPSFQAPLFLADCFIVFDDRSSPADFICQNQQKGAKLATKTKWRSLYSVIRCTNIFSESINWQSLCSCLPCTAIVLQKLMVWYHKNTQLYCYLC